MTTSKVTQLKWVPPMNTDGYRASSVHEAVRNAAADIFGDEDMCTAGEVILAEKAMRATRETAADLFSAAELAVLYAAEKRLETEVQPQRVAALSKAIDTYQQLTGRNPTPATILTIQARLWPAREACHAARPDMWLTRGEVIAREAATKAAG